MRKVVTVIFLLVSFLSEAQELKKKNAPFTIRGNVGIPRSISSQMYRKTFYGIFEANLSCNVRLFSNFYAGLGYQNTMFQNGKFLAYTYFKHSIPYDTKLMHQGIFFKLGYDRFSSQNFYVSYALNSGIMLANYMNVNADTSAVNRPYGALKFTAPYLQPEATFNFIVDETLSFSLMLSYTTVLTKFDPKAPRFNHFEEVSKSSNKYFMSWFTFGFGFSVLLGKK
ncbi:MAG: hypothetical protein KF900_07115 [Bacteroidetes bacterium]|nr:hypothetical protein [Bacteroidota bacterium]